MNIEKLFTVTTLFIIVACSFTGVFASDDNEVNISDNVLTLHNVKFNIPEGYKEDESQRKIGETYDDGKYSTCVFVKDDKVIKMTVKYDTDPTRFTLKAGEEVPRSMTVKNINGMGTLGSPMKFNYENNGNVAEIEAPDQGLIEQVIYTETS